MFREKYENFSGKCYQEIFVFLDGKYIQEIENVLSKYEEAEVIISTSIEEVKHSETMASTPTPSSEDFHR